MGGRAVAVSEDLAWQVLRHGANEKKVSNWIVIQSIANDISVWSLYLLLEACNGVE